MQVHGDDVVCAGGGELVGDEFGGDGSPTSVLLVLARVGKVGDERRHTLRRSDLARVDHDQHLHQVVVDVGPAARLNIDSTTGGFPTGVVTITPRRWVPITPITPLFERAKELFNTHHSKKKRKSLENLGNFGEKFGKNFGEIAIESILTREKGAPMIAYKL